MAELKWVCVYPFDFTESLFFHRNICENLFQQFTMTQVAIVFIFCEKQNHLFRCFDHKLFIVFFIPFGEFYHLNPSLWKKFLDALKIGKKNI